MKSIVQNFTLLIFIIQVGLSSLAASNINIEPDITANKIYCKDLKISANQLPGLKDNLSRRSPLDQWFIHREATQAETFTLNEAIKKALDPNFGKTLTLDDWHQLEDAVTETHPMTLKTIRAEIKKMGGLSTVVDAKDPMTAEGRKKDLLFYGGTKIIYSQSLPQSNSPLRVPGVVMHPAWPGSEIKIFNSVRGEVNLDEGYGWLGGMLLDRALENKIANAIWPGVMARGLTFSDLRNTNGVPAQFDTLRDYLRSNINLKLQKANSALHPQAGDRNQLHMQLSQLIEIYMSVVKAEFPDGAFIKNFGEFATGDKGTQIRSFKYDANKIASNYLNKLDSILDGQSYAGLTDPEFQLKMRAGEGETESPFLNQLLLNPDIILAQEKLEVVKTATGINHEIRVSVRHGVAVRAWVRLSDFEYLGDLSADVAFVNEFFRRAPVEVRQLSGGFDVIHVVDIDGNISRKIIEFNAGPADGSGLPRVMPVDANLLKSELMGEPTFLIQMLNSAFAGGPSGQLKYLRSLKENKEKWYKESIDDFSVSEGIKYFRDMYLKEFDLEPTVAKSNQILQKLASLIEQIDPQNTNEELPKYYEGAAHYLKIRLEGKLP